MQSACRHAGVTQWTYFHTRTAVLKITLAPAYPQALCIAEETEFLRGYGLSTTSTNISFAVSDTLYATTTVYHFTISDNKHASFWQCCAR